MKETNQSYAEVHTLRSKPFFVKPIPFFIFSSLVVFTVIYFWMLFLAGSGLDESSKSMYFDTAFTYAIFLYPLYMLPFLLRSKKSDAWDFFILNFLLGWTFIGWVVLLVMNFKPDAHVHKHVYPISLSGTNRLGNSFYTNLKRNTQSDTGRFVNRIILRNFKNVKNTNTIPQKISWLIVVVAVVLWLVFR